MPSAIERASRGTFAIAVVALLLACSSLLWQGARAGSPLPTSAAVPGLLDRIERSGELHAGYGVYPPYSMEDPVSKKVSGLSVEIIEQIGRELKTKVVWHRINFNTMAADLRRGDYDVLADPIFQTVPRAREFAFTAPYAYFADGIAVVRKNDTRFTNLASLDRGDVTIAVGQGWVSETLARNLLQKAKIVAVQTATDLLQVFNEVISGRADVAISDAADARRIVKEHPNNLKALWLEDPPAVMPAGFALRPEDAKGAAFLTVSLRNLESMGFLDSLNKKYGVSAFRSRRELPSAAPGRKE